MLLLVLALPSQAQGISLLDTRQQLDMPLIALLSKSINASCNYAFDGNREAYCQNKCADMQTRLHTLDLVLTRTHRPKTLLKHAIEDYQHAVETCKLSWQNLDLPHTIVPFADLAAQLAQGKLPQAKS